MGLSVEAAAHGKAVDSEDRAEALCAHFPERAERILLTASKLPASGPLAFQGRGVSVFLVDQGEEQIRLGPRQRGESRLRAHARQTRLVFCLPVTDALSSTEQAEAGRGAEP